MRVDGLTGDLRTLVGPMGPFPSALLSSEAPQAAVSLLGALLVRDLDGEQVVARVVETEAYREQDPASHSHRGRTPRTEPMFAGPGTLYVYRSYGLHWCLNVVVEPEGVGAAVLVRAAVVLRGHEPVNRRRPDARGSAALLRGPGCLTAGLDVDAVRHDGGDAIAGSQGLRLARDEWRATKDSWIAGPRVGVRSAADVPWRYHLLHVPEVSAYRRSPRATGPLAAPMSNEMARGDASGR